MTCPECGAPIKDRRGDFKHQPVPGLVVKLRGMLVGRDRNGHVSHAISRIGPLYRLIARLILTKPDRMTGPEMRFLRTRCGWERQELAEILGVSPALVSRWEGGKQPIELQVDRLMRVLTARESAGTELELDVLRGITKAAPRALRLDLGLRGTEWVEAGRR